MREPPNTSSAIVRPSVRKVPEVNAVVKDWRKVSLRVALCYPSTYRVGMSSLTVQLLYHLLNSDPDVACERAFFEEGEVPRSIESGRPLRDFDVLLFTLPYELNYADALKMLAASEIPLKWAEREEGPLVVAGGPCVFENPAPLLEFFDAFAIGDAEALLPPLVEAAINASSREEVLEALAGEDGFLIPKYPRNKPVRAVKLKSLAGAPHPTAEVVPLSREHEPVYGRAFIVEVTRGCARGCRFCLIGCAFRPFRYRPLNELEEVISKGVKVTGVSKVVLIGPVVSDHPRFADLLEFVVSSGLEVSVPSMRADALDERSLELLARGKQRTLTLAPESPVEAERAALNKPITNEQLLAAAKAAKAAGMKNIKLYFMAGLPTRAEGKLESLKELLASVRDVGFAPRSVRVSATPFIPKARTPMQWLPQAPLAKLRSEARAMAKVVRSLGARFSAYDARAAQVEAALARGGDEVSRALELAASLGPGIGAYRLAFRRAGLNLEELATKALELDSKLPWEELATVGLPRECLVSELDDLLSLC